MTVCSTAFATLGRKQATALGQPQLPIAVVPHPFGLRTREGVHLLAEQCVDDVFRLVCEPGPRETTAVSPSSLRSGRAALIEVVNDITAINNIYRERRWSDGLPVVPPTVERVELMLRHTRRRPEEIVATVAPGFGAATIELIAVNAVLAGCDPEYLPVLVAAVEAVAAPEFNLQGIQATTNPAAVWLIVNGPIAKRLGVNGGINCLGQGTWANATLGRALRLILQNVGGALPGEMDQATHGQPGKYSFCCAENEAANPWVPLHVERGYSLVCSTVTVVGAEGTISMNTHAKDVDDLLRVITDTMAHAPSNEYCHGSGEPWIVLCPEHAEILKAGGLSKSDVKRRLWEQSKMSAGRLGAKDLARAQDGRGAELGEIGPNTMLPISIQPELIGILVAGGPGTHSVYVPSFGINRSVTREVMCSV